MLSKSRMKGPMAHEALLSLALPSSSALLPSMSRRLTSLPKVAPRISPRLLTANTISGSGLFQTDPEWIPTSAPGPTADSTGAFVNTSASGPMPTSRYCDHKPCCRSTCLSSAAFADPGTMLASEPPNRATTRLRIDSALVASPSACSSITRSSKLEAKVTPEALMT